MELAEAQAEIIRLNLEIIRLEHALTTVEMLAAALVPPKTIIIDYAKDLTKQETLVLLGIMAGDSTNEMAAKLFLSPSTIKVYIQRVYTKLDVHNRGGATMAGVHLGLDVPEADTTDT
jgi:DNA-binding NarL/FixJ family response regulator